MPLPVLCAAPATPAADEIAYGSKPPLSSGGTDHDSRHTDEPRRRTPERTGEEPPRTLLKQRCGRWFLALASAEAENPTLPLHRHQQATTTSLRGLRKGEYGFPVLRRIFGNVKYGRSVGDVHADGVVDAGVQVALEKTAVLIVAGRDLAMAVGRRVVGEGIQILAPLDGGPRRDTRSDEGRWGTA